MKYLIFLLLLGATLYFSFRVGSDSGSFPMTRVAETTATRDVPQAQRQKVILFTGTSWCGACRQLEKQVISKPSWKEFAAREIEFTSYDVPRDPSRIQSHVLRQMERYNIRSFPTMLIVNDRFEKIDQISGSGPPVENYKKWIRDHARAAGKGA